MNSEFQWIFAALACGSKIWGGLVSQRAPVPEIKRSNRRKMQERGCCLENRALRGNSDSIAMNDKRLPQAFAILFIRQRNFPNIPMGNNNLQGRAGLSFLRVPGNLGKPADVW